MLALFLQHFDSDEDKQIFTEIYNRFESYILKTATDRLYNKTYIQDCVQDTFLELAHSFENFKKVSDENSKKAYLVTICKRCAIKINNQADNSCIPIEDVPEIETTESSYRNFQEENILDISDIICDMDEKYSEPLIMKYAEGYSLAEISDKLGISVNTVKQRLYRGRKTIVDSLRTE